MLHVLAELVGSPLSAVIDDMRRGTGRQINHLDRAWGDNGAGQRSTCASENGGIRCPDFPLINDDRAVRTGRVCKSARVKNAAERRRRRILVRQRIGGGV